MSKKNTAQKYSVLMSVYQKDNANWLKESIDSMLAQTITPSEFVIVKDGPVPQEVTNIINGFVEKYPNLFKIIQLEHNSGLGIALSTGIKECSHEYIARMDADDYSVPERIEEELKIFQKHPELDLVGSNVDEFETDIQHPTSSVILPEDQEDIYNFAKKRCPFRHPSLLYKKSAVLSAGNYHDVYLCEDYDLYIRMLQKGSKCYNIQKPLTYMRIDHNFFRRRGGIKYLKSILNFKRMQVKTGFFSKKDFIISSIPHIFVCLMPNGMRDNIYRHLLRKTPNTSNIDNQPIRVLHVVPNMQAGGLETFIMNIYRNIDRDKIQFDFVVHYNAPKFYDSEIESLGGQIYRFSLRDDNNILRYIRQLNQFYSKHPEYKIVHCHMNSIGYLHFLIAKKHGVKVRISHSHNSATEKSLKGRVKAMTIKPVKTISTHNLACSQSAGEFLFGKKPFSIIPNSIDFQNFAYNIKKRIDYRKMLGIQDELVIGHIGRFNRQKNHPYVLQIFKNIHDKNPNSRLLLAGDGELLPKMKDFAQKLGISQYVHFLGNIKDTPSFYSAIDAFILPSLFEGLPVVGLEAQANGVSCFFSDAVTREVVIDNSLTHFISIHQTPEKWSNAIIHNQERKVDKPIYSAAYDAKQQADHLAQFYHNLMESTYA